MQSLTASTVITAGLLSALVSAASWAGERQPFEKVKGWEVERTVGDAGPNPCVASRTYKDRDDNNAVNAVVFALDGSRAVLVLAYQGWGWDKNEKVTVPLALDKKLIDAKSRWVGDAEMLSTKLPDTVVPDLLAARKIILRFDDSDADFDIAGFPQAYEALRRCDAAPARTASVAPAPLAPKATAPAEPSAARVKAYFVGLMLQQVIKECEVTTTGPQRSAVEAKLSALQPEMTAIDTALREQVRTRPAPYCPPPSDEPKFQVTLRDFVERTPEDFTAAVERRGAEAAAVDEKLPKL
ncbi:hypothetical protein [Methylobacterium sp. WSM2598]|uniref:hypothetical protein n=1 Tax=Methylobacterium sp. WSM2598 TaxID=398261 RepID=UPI0003634632|nr:hypothetical protein [Methylobacterium sp. WSM2598]